MNWNTSNRRSELPSDWPSRRAATRDRARGQCEALLHDGTRCTWAGTDCDHVKPGSDHRLENLQWLCEWHHKAKTAQEARQNRTYYTNKRPKTSHPGLK